MGWTARVSVGALVACAAAGAANPAGAAPRYGIDQGWHDVTMSAAAVQPFTQHGAVTEHALVSAGFSEVRLRGSPLCHATGAGYWLGQGTERGGLIEYAVPHRDRHKNPTAADVVRPQPTSKEGFDWRDTTPAVGDGSGGLRVAASCAEDGSRGAATGTLRDGPGPRVGGSSVLAAVGPAGTFTGTARSYLADLGVTTGGAFDSLTALVHVTLPADATEPTVTYRLTLTRAGFDARPRAAFDSDTVTLAGTELPAHRLLDQFQEQKRALPIPWADLVGLTLVSPTVGRDPDGRVLVTAPAALVRTVPGPVVAAAGLPRTVQPLTINEFGGGLRLGSATFAARTGGTA